MAVSTISTASKQIKYKDVRISNISLTGGYANIASYKPSGMNNFLFAAVYNMPSGQFCIVGANGALAFSTPNTETISYIDVRYYYTD